MLVLSRKAGESIVIDQGIVIHVISVSGSLVRLGIDAPKHVSIDRSEVIERRQSQPTANSCDDSSGVVHARNE